MRTFSHKYKGMSCYTWWGIFANTSDEKAINGIFAPDFRQLISLFLNSFVYFISFSYFDWHNYALMRFESTNSSNCFLQLPTALADPENYFEY